MGQQGFGGGAQGIGQRLAALEQQKNNVMAGIPEAPQGHSFDLIDTRALERSLLQSGTHLFDIKAQVKAAGLAGAGKVRVNKAGCLDRCAAGPVAVVYPEGTWYTYVDAADIDEIVESHLKNGQVVERLVTPAELGR